MIRSIVLLALFCHATSGTIVSKLSSQFTETLKIKCDSLPFRTVYNEKICYFVIDADVDISTTSNRCSSALAEAKVAQPEKVPEGVWSLLFLEKTSFISNAESKGKTKAMCICENRFPTSTSTAPRSFLDQDLTARMANDAHVVEIPRSTGDWPDNYYHGDIRNTTFNLQQDGFDKFETIALQFSIDFRSQCEFATRRSGRWDWNPTRFPNPFKRGEQFDIRFRIHDDHFQVFANREEIGNYTFRIPLSTVNTLGINGAGYFSYVRLGEQYDPVAYSGQTTIAKVSNKRSDEDEKSLLPVVEVFASGFPVCGKQDACSATKQSATSVNRADCKSLVITGRFTPKVGFVGPSFWINLKRKNGDIALHFIARWNEKDVGLNSWMAAHPGGWQTNVRNRLPYKAGEMFKIAIVNDVLGFKITVNGVYFTTFEHRMCNSDIAEVEVSPFVYDLGIQLN